jgi:hypothetical protein
MVVSTKMLKKMVVSLIWSFSVKTRLSFSGGGWGGVVVVVVIHVRAPHPHVVKETPGFFVVRMEKYDMPSPTTTRHVFPLWQRRERRHGGAAAGLGYF